MVVKESQIRKDLVVSMGQELEKRYCKLCNKETEHQKSREKYRYRLKGLGNKEFKKEMCIECSDIKFVEQNNEEGLVFSVLLKDDIKIGTIIREEE